MRMAIPPIVPPLLLSIAALRVPVETLFAVTLIMAWEPIVPAPGAVQDRKAASPCVVRSPVRLKLMLALPTMFPPLPPLLLTIAALRVPVEMLAAVTLITASDPIVPPAFEIVRVASPCVVRSPVEIKAKVGAPDDVPAGEV